MKIIQRIVRPCACFCLLAGLGGCKNAEEPDVLPPEIAWVFPEDGDTVNLLYWAEICFSESMDESTLTSSSAYIRSETGDAVGAEIEFVDVTNTTDPFSKIYLKPLSPQSTGLYTATLTTDITDLNGNKLSSNYSFSFYVDGVSLSDSDGAASDHFGHSTAIMGEYAFIGAPDYDNRKGCAYVFKRGADGEWTEYQQLFASDGEAGDSFGNSVSIYYAEGLYEEAAVWGGNAAYVFELDSAGTWEETAVLTSANPWFQTYCVYILMDWVLVGAPGADISGNVNQGAVFVFEREGDGSWSQADILYDSSGDADDWYGYSVYMGGCIAIGAPGVNSFKGRLYVYDLTGSLKMTHTGLNYFDDVGASIAEAAEGTLLCGAPGVEDTGGAVYVFKKVGDDSWNYHATLTGSDCSADDQFGYSLCAGTEYIVVGSPGREEQKGAAYIFDIEDDFSEAGKLTDLSGEASDCFGTSVSMDFFVDNGIDKGDYILVSSPNADVSGHAEQGKILVYSTGPSNL